MQGYRRLDGFYITKFISVLSSKSNFFSDASNRFEFSTRDGSIFGLRRVLDLRQISRLVLNMHFFTLCKKKGTKKTMTTHRSLTTLGRNTTTRINTA